MKVRIILGVGAILLLASLFICIIWWWRIDYGRSQFQRAQRQVLDLGVTLQSITNLRDDIPGPTYKDAINVILQYPNFRTRFQQNGHQNILKGVDLWGTPFIYIIDQKEEYAIIRSAGMNMKNEGGLGDDIEYRFFCNH